MAAHLKVHIKVLLLSECCRAALATWAPTAQKRTRDDFRVPTKKIFNAGK